jgi:crossover junction endodeoxyribonuclease RuvC
VIVQNHTLRILGIDPGLRATGYGCIDIGVVGANEGIVLVEAGVIRLDATQSIPMRLCELRNDLVQIMDRLKPGRVAVEKLYSHYAHPTTAIKMGHARGVIMLTAAEQNIPLTELSATEVKRAITGRGHAGKSQMQRAIQAICQLRELPSPSDVADALAVAVTSARHHRAET